MYAGTDVCNPGNSFRHEIDENVTAEQGLHPNKEQATKDEARQVERELNYFLHMSPVGGHGI
jgi:hypothetical protein